MDKEKGIEKLKALLLEKSSLANVEPVFTDENGNEYTIDNENALKVLNDILEQAFIPFIAEQVINVGYGNVKEAIEDFAEILKMRIYIYVNCQYPHDDKIEVLKAMFSRINELKKELYSEGDNERH